MPGDFVHGADLERAHRFTRRAARPAAEDAPAQTFWHWFAVGVLVFCWIAEASLCAERGF